MAFSDDDINRIAQFVATFEETKQWLGGELVKRLMTAGSTAATEMQMYSLAVAFQVFARACLVALNEDLRRAAEEHARRLIDSCPPPLGPPNAH